MGNRLKGKNAVITGAGRGIGRAVTVALAEEGANVVVCDLGCSPDGTGADRDPADAVVEECRRLGVEATAHYGDVSDFGAAEEMINTCVHNFGKIDILCNIAGNNTWNMIFDMSEEQWDRVIAVHLKGTFNLTRHATPLMRQQRHGRIINCTSAAATRLAPLGNANYVAAKGGILSFTYAIAKEMGRYGVTCNAFAPNAKTRLWGKWSHEAAERRLAPKKLVDGLASQITDASCFASLMAYLASDAAANVNGCAFFILGKTLGILSNPEIVRQVTIGRRREDRWTFEEIEKRVSQELLVDYINPAPPELSNS